MAIRLAHAICPKDEWPRARDLVDYAWPMFGRPQKILTDSGKDFRGDAFARGCDEFGIETGRRHRGRVHEGGVVERPLGKLNTAIGGQYGMTGRTVADRDDYQRRIARHARLWPAEGGVVSRRPPVREADVTVLDPNLTLRRLVAGLPDLDAGRLATFRDNLALAIDGGLAPTTMTRNVSWFQSASKAETAPKSAADRDCAEGVSIRVQGGDGTQGMPILFSSATSFNPRPRRRQHPSTMLMEGGKSP